MGIDLSLTSTGVAVAGSQAVPIVFTVGSKGHAGDSLASRRYRLGQIAYRLEQEAKFNVPDMIVVEGPSMNSRFGHPHDRSGLWWLVVYQLGGTWPIVEVSPSQRTLYATGKGNAPKDRVLTDVVRRYPDVQVTDNNEADALLLAAMGMRYLGEPLEPSLPKPHLAALEKVRWQV